MAAVAIVPLWVYLGKSPVWADRTAERPSAWRLAPPRVLDSLCTLVPDAFGGQRRGQANLARAVGVHNVNESSGGYVGLATLLWLVPQALRANRQSSRVGFLALLAAAGFLGAFAYPPVSNVMRAIPLLNVTDLRRLTLWVAFAGAMLGGVGLDHLSVAWSAWVGRWWLGLGVSASLALLLGAAVAPTAEARLRSRAERHYLHAVGTTGNEALDPQAALARADRQVKAALRDAPRTLAVAGVQIGGLALLALLSHRGAISWRWTRAAIVGLTLVEVFHHARQINPTLDPRDDKPVTQVIARLRAGLRDGRRVLGLGQELLPNVAMRYGLADPRNYDSVELSRSLDWFAPLYEDDGRPRSSRGTIGWPGVVRARDRLREASVAAVVAATPPPAGLDAVVERVGAAWVAWLDSEPIVSGSAGSTVESAIVNDGTLDAVINSKTESTLIFRQTFDPGWTARVDGEPVGVFPYRGAFLSVKVGAGRRRVRLEYDPPEVRAACAVSLGSVAACLVAFAWRGGSGDRRIHGRGLAGAEPSR
jgi:hypothetical protein